MEDQVSSRTFFNPRKPLFWVAGIAVAAAFFASGALVSRAAFEDDATVAPGNDTPLVRPGLTGGGTGANPAVTTPNGPADVVTLDGGRGPASASYPACSAPLPAGVVTATGIDLSKAGFIPALPGTGFSPLRATVTVQSDCAKDGSGTPGNLVFESSWNHDATKLDAYVSQIKTGNRVANVIRQDSATFWVDGYRFDLGVSGYQGLPVPGDPSSGGPRSSAGGPSVDGGPRDADFARSAEVLKELIARVAPAVDQKCFWVAGGGDWSSLAGAGVGDPRPTIPSGFTQAELNIVSFAPPPAGCDSSLKPTEGFSLNAGWQKNANSNDFAYLGVSVYSTGATSDYPGQISEYGANWSNGVYQFGVYAKSARPLGVDAIRNIGRALDPGFDDRCFITERELAEGELPGLGFHAAKAPRDYSLVASRLRANEVPSACVTPPGFAPSYTLSWTFQKGADTIEANANRYGGSPSSDGSGYQSQNSLGWTDARGTNYFVNAYSRGVNPTVDRDDLIAVAKSMDPAFDISKLLEGGGDKPVARPVEDRGR